MASCAYCGSTLLWVKKKVDGVEFCNDSCVANGWIVMSAQAIPDGTALEASYRVYHALCPECGSAGPIDVFTSHSVWSALVLTSWKSTPHVCCRSCGVRFQVLATLSSLLLGWWGFPWGLLVTPIQVVRNVVGMFRGANPSGPSEKLQHMVRLQLAAAGTQE